eukprot:s1364_g17.t1
MNGPGLRATGSSDPAQSTPELRARKSKSSARGSEVSGRGSVHSAEVTSDREDQSPPVEAETELPQRRRSDASVPPSDDERRSQASQRSLRSGQSETSALEGSNEDPSEASYRRQRRRDFEGDQGHPEASTAEAPKTAKPQQKPQQKPKEPKEPKELKETKQPKEPKEPKGRRKQQKLGSPPSAAQGSAKLGRRTADKADENDVSRARRDSQDDDRRASADSHRSSWQSARRSVEERSVTHMHFAAGGWNRFVQQGTQTVEPEKRSADEADENVTWSSVEQREKWWIPKKDPRRRRRQRDAQTKRMNTTRVVPAVPPKTTTIAPPLSLELMEPEKRSADESAAPSSQRTPRSQGGERSEATRKDTPSPRRSDRRDSLRDIPQQKVNAGRQGLAFPFFFHPWLGKPRSSHGGL